MWLSAEQALSRLGVKAQTLYASVSRGRIRARPDPTDPRRSQYSGEDVDRLAARARGRPSTVAIAEEAISWGEPVLSSALSTVSGGRLYYRGQDAVELAREATLEGIASLLWGGAWSGERYSSGRHAGDATAGTEAPAGPPLAAAFQALATRATDARPSEGLGSGVLRDEAGHIVLTLADALLGPGEGSLHERMAQAFHRPEATDALRAALVLLADHELNASTFAARVAVSTGASLSAGALAGLAALSGPRHGGASAATSALADDIAAEHHAGVALRAWLDEGRAIPGFGHRLYPSGDVRCTALLARIPVPPAYRALLEAAEPLTAEPPNVDFALAALQAAHDLPREAPLTMFVLARSVGWLAHMLEQVQTGAVIRPRARYTGVSPSAPSARR